MLSQKPELDYDELFAQVAKYTSLLFLLSLNVLLQYFILQLEVMIAFLHGKLSKGIYVEIPHGMSIEHKTGNILSFKKLFTDRNRLHVPGTKIWSSVPFTWVSRNQTPIQVYSCV